MDKKTMILCICGIPVLCAVIAVSVFFLYSDGGFTRNVFGAIQSIEQRYTPAPKAMSVKTSNEAVAAPAEQAAPADKPVKGKDKGKKSASKDSSPAAKWAVSLMGRAYTLEQDADGSLVASTIGGGKVWTCPLDGKIAGMVGKVDFYSNGKEQLILIAGSKLHIISRLGKDIEGYPVNLGSEIALGPDVYDFTGAKRFNIVVLTKDNKIEMYNLKGLKHKNWKGISHKEKFTSLPVSLVKQGKNYWVAWTSGHTVVYPFYGGEPVKELEGNVSADKVKL